MKTIKQINKEFNEKLKDGYFHKESIQDDNAICHTNWDKVELFINKLLRKYYEKNNQ